WVFASAKSRMRGALRFPTHHGWQSKLSAPSSDRFAATFSHEGRRGAEDVEAAAPAKRAPLSPGGRGDGGEGGAEPVGHTARAYATSLFFSIIPASACTCRSAMPISRRCSAVLST